MERIMCMFYERIIQVEQEDEVRIRDRGGFTSQCWIRKLSRIECERRKPRGWETCLMKRTRGVGGRMMDRECMRERIRIERAKGTHEKARLTFVIKAVYPDGCEEITRNFSHSLWPWEARRTR